jgi:hypothetical protein
MMKKSAIQISVPKNRSRSDGTSNRKALSPPIRRKGTPMRSVRRAAPESRLSLWNFLLIVIQHFILCVFDLVAPLFGIVMHDYDSEEHDQGKSEQDVCPCLHFHKITSISSVQVLGFPFPAEKMSTMMPIMAAVVNPIVAIIDMSILYLPEICCTGKERNQGTASAARGP